MSKIRPKLLFKSSCWSPRLFCTLLSVRGICNLIQDPRFFLFCLHFCSGILPWIPFFCLFFVHIFKVQALYEVVSLNKRRMDILLQPILWSPTWSQAVAELESVGQKLLLVQQYSSGTDLGPRTTTKTLGSYEEL